MTKVDLSNCDREPIRTPGAIQAHGVLLMLDERHKITQISANSPSLLGIAPKDLLGLDLLTLTSGDGAPDLRESLTSANPAIHNPYKIIINERAFDAVLHRGAQVMIELEPTSRQTEVEFKSFYHLSREVIVRLRSARTPTELYQHAVKLVREVSNFDRVLIYRFDEEWNGHVLAEERSESVQSYMDLHFPASDIPAQARDLYLLNRLRIIPDVNYKLVPVGPEDPERPIDMSYSVLRSVSPIHVEYLRNMGATASMSVSLVQNGRLWGLISCTHESGTRFMSFESRAVCDLVGELTSSLLPSRESEFDANRRYQIGQSQRQLLQAIANEEDLLAGLVRQPETLLGLVEATGAAVYFDGKLSVVGQAPTDEQLRELIAFVSARTGEDVFITTSLVDQVPEAIEYRKVACGVLGFSISRGHSNFVLWFRPEAVQTLKWGGNPNKAVEIKDGEPILHPRKSFEAWKETVRLRSLPWTEDEIQATRELRSAIIDLVLQRMERITKLNTELERSNTELDSFAYAASHDLKEPLRGIFNYASLLLRQEPPLPDDVTARLRTITRLSTRMENLINSLLHYSQVGRTDLTLRETSLGEVVGQTIETLRSRIEERGAIVRVPSSLPSVIADRVQLTEVFTNLMTNAIKYNKSEPPVIEVGCSAIDDGGRVTAFIKDNGIGIAPGHRESIFKIFKRLHGKDEYGGGTGTGLTITKKIIERHNGELRVESNPGEGSTFSFTLQGGLSRGADVRV